MLPLWLTMMEIIYERFGNRPFWRYRLYIKNNDSFHLKHWLLIAIKIENKNFVRRNGRYNVRAETDIYGGRAK